MTLLEADPPPPATSSPSSLLLWRAALVTGLAGEAHAEEAEEEARGNMEGAEVKSARSARST